MTIGLLCFSCSDSQAVKRTKLSHSQLPKAIVLDIEGTVAPISFVADVMFPYARDNVRQHLQEHYDSQEAQADIDAIRQQVHGFAFNLSRVQGSVLVTSALHLASR